MASELGFAAAAAEATVAKVEMNQTSFMLVLWLYVCVVLEQETKVQ